MHKDGSSLPTNAGPAGPRKRRQRHQMDYTVACPGVRSVEKTAVGWNQDDPAADDATDGTLTCSELGKVIHTAVTLGTVQK